MILQTQVSRRAFLTTSSHTAGALILGFCLPMRAQAREQAQQGPNKIFKPNAWLRITADNQVTVLVENQNWDWARAHIRP